MLTFLTFTFLILLFVAYNTIKIVPMRENFVVERLGKFRAVLTPGLHILIPFFDRIAYRHEMREQVFDIPSQSCISQDNIQIEVDGLVYLKVNDPQKASYGIGNYRLAAINLAQTTMRSEVGKLRLSQTFSERESLNEKIVKEIDSASEPWGMKVLRYEVMNIKPSANVVTTLEKQMEAEREKRAEITLAQAQKESNVLTSEGDRQEAINISEGEKQKRVNIAIGRAREIELLADATSKGINLISEAIQAPGGDKAIKMRLMEKFIHEIGDILGEAKVAILPNEMANIRGVFQGVEKVTTTVKGSKQ
ncbi:MAG: paraslipin [Bacteriovoracaceae bacterium]|nr:paraslipin [Bacteriovoracaceae bacterium]